MADEAKAQEAKKDQGDKPFDQEQQSSTQKADQESQGTTGNTGATSTVTTNAPDTFPREYVENLRNENASARTRNKELEARLQEIEDRDKSEAEKATAKAEREAKAREAAEAELLRLKVATEKEIPGDAVGLLTATTREDLEAQADSILELRKQAQPKSDFDAGARESTTTRTPEQQHAVDIAKLLGRDPEASVGNQ